MLRGINNNEVTVWINAIKKAVPPVVFQTLLQKAEQELPVKRFQKISKSLSDSLQPA
jgi:hypothetical protein